jgi:hypothetical protein
MTTDNSPAPARAPRIKEARLTTVVEQKKIQLYIDQSVPEKHKLATQRALLGQITRSTAIRVKCLQCCGYQRDEIKTCAVLTCALFPVRPYQDKSTDEDTGEE